jgi:hypothetical protein
VATVAVPSGDPTGEPVSPELALVDPSLAERLREALPDAPVRVAPPPTRFETPEPIPRLASLAEPAGETEVGPDSPLTTGAADAVMLRLVPPATPDEDDLRLVPSATPDEGEAVAEDVTAPEPVSLDPAPDLVPPGPGPVAFVVASPEPVVEPEEAGAALESPPEPEPEPEPEPVAFVVASPEPVVEPEEAGAALESPPEPEPEPEPVAFVVASPEPVVEPEPVHVRAAVPVERSTEAPREARPPLVLPRRRRRRWRHTLLLLLFLVVAGAFVAVGVVAERGERAIAEANEQGSEAPVIERPGVTGAPSSEPPAGQPSSESAAPSEPEGSGAQTPPATPTPTPPAPRRFSWAPVENAVAYHVELFRGADQILARETTKPVLDLGESWRHEGRLVRLTPGTYRWYVWPVTSSGRAAQAVVQARLTVP